MCFNCDTLLGDATRTLVLSYILENTDLLSQIQPPLVVYITEPHSGLCIFVDLIKNIFNHRYQKLAPDWKSTEVIIVAAPTEPLVQDSLIKETYPQGTSWNNKQKTIYQDSGSHSGS